MESVLVATSKGLIRFNSEFEIINIFFEGFSVNLFYEDPRNGKWWVGVKHKHWGQKLHVSNDKGNNWNEVDAPSYEGQTLPNGKPAKLKDLWAMHHGGFSNPGALWLGTEPGGLFKSENHGETFELVESLWNHPSRLKEEQWFGAGSDYPFIHSVVLDPEDENHIYIAVSCAGVFESLDRGESWVPRNKGLKATYLPKPDVEVGHDPHRLLISKTNPEILWQQNHCGIFVTKDGAKNWIDVSAKTGYPNYGFSIAIDEQNPAKAWVIPVESDEQRVAPGLKLQVYQTSDFGTSWENISIGLPDKHVFDIVLRQSFAKKDNVLVFGTTNGNLYFSNEKAPHWKLVSFNLAKVTSVTII